MKGNKAAKKVHYTEAEAREFGEGAKGVKIRILIGEDDGAPFYVLRMIEIEPGGYTPRHSHPFEHENFVVSGSGEVLIEGKKEQIIRGDVVFIPPVLEHQYRNTGKEMLEFLCGIPVERFRKSTSDLEED